MNCVVVLRDQSAALELLVSGRRAMSVLMAANSERANGEPAVLVAAVDQAPNETLPPANDRGAEGSPGGGAGRLAYGEGHRMADRVLARS